MLVRGGTSSVGLALVELGRLRGLTVLATTRSADRLGLLTDLGAYAVVDDGHIADQVRARHPDGVDGAVDLVGATTLHDTLRAVRPGGTVCFTGVLADRWTIPDR